jgi:hypothetical protein
LTYSFLLLAAVILLPVIGVAQASSNRGDWSDENIEALRECTEQGYEDGRNGPFDHSEFKKCEALSSSIEPELEGESSTYYEAFIEGCLSVEGNTEEVCESATDA